MHKLTTGDPKFNPAEPVEINGFVFIPLSPALSQHAADLIDPPRPKGWPSGPRPDAPPARKGSRYVAPPRPAFAAGYDRPCNVRQEGDEYVCATCARRWGFDDERPYCENDPAWKD